MRILKIGAAAVALLIIVMGVVGHFLPKEYGGERTREIAAPPEVIFDLVNDVEKQMLWLPWKKADSTVEVTYSEERKGVGAWYSWTSENSGSGKMTITASEPPTRVTTRVEFGPKHEITGYYRLEPRGEKVAVTWGMRGTQEGVFHRWAGLIMPAFLKMAFDDGLERLAKVAETTPVLPAPSPEPRELEAPAAGGGPG